MKIEFRFNATRVQSIEKQLNEVIANIVSSSHISSVAKVVEIASFDNERDKVGCSNSMALTKIDEYLDAGNDLDGLLLDMTEALVDKGFLSREIDVSKMRDLKNSHIKAAMKQIDEALEEN